MDALHRFQPRADGGHRGGSLLTSVFGAIKGGGSGEVEKLSQAE